MLKKNLSLEQIEKYFLLKRFGKYKDIYIKIHKTNIMIYIAINIRVSKSIKKHFFECHYENEVCHKAYYECLDINIFACI